MPISEFWANGNGLFPCPRPGGIYYFLTHLRAVRQGKWKLHLPRPERPPWLGQFSTNQHIHPSDDIAITRPILFDIDADIGETWDVADKHPDVVARLTAVAEAARTDIGDYNRVGNGARFFDEGTRRPDAAKWNSTKTNRSGREEALFLGE